MMMYTDCAYRVGAKIKEMPYIVRDQCFVGTKRFYKVYNASKPTTAPREKRYLPLQMEGRICAGNISSKGISKVHT